MTTPGRWFPFHCVVAGMVLCSAYAQAKTCDDFPGGPPPLGFWDKMRWDVGARGEAPFGPSLGGRAAVEYIIHPNVDLGLRADYAYESGGRQTLVLSAETRIFFWFQYGGQGANVCGYKVRYHERLGGAPYVLLSAGGGIDLAPRVRATGLGRVGLGFDKMLDRKRSVFVEIGGAVGTMAGGFASVGLRW